MTAYSITTFEQLCERLAHLNDEGFSLLINEIDPKALTCHIRIEGDGYGPRIPGYLLQALADLQTSTMRTYAFLAKGKEDLRGLPKEDLWSVIEVEEGSLKIGISPTKLFFEIPQEMLKDLPPFLKSLVMLSPFLLLAAFGVYCVDSNAQVEKHRISEQVELARLQTQVDIKREETIQKAFNAITIAANTNSQLKGALDVAERNARSGVEGIVQNAAGATRIDVGMKTFSSEEIQKLQTPESLPVKRRPKEGDFRIVQINTEKPGSWKVQLKDEKTHEKIPAHFDPETLFLSLDRAKEIFDYQRDEKTIHVKLSVVEKGTNVSYEIDELSPT